MAGLLRLVLAQGALFVGRAHDNPGAMEPEVVIEQTMMFSSLPSGALLELAAAVTRAPEYPLIPMRVVRIPMRDVSLIADVDSEGWQQYYPLQRSPQVR